MIIAPATAASWLHELANDVDAPDGARGGSRTSPRTQLKA
jgi:hypothetical protein